MQKAVIQIARIAGDDYNLNELIGKNLYAPKEVPIFRDFRYAKSRKQVFTVRKGAHIGQVWSWVADDEGRYWLIFEDGKGGLYGVPAVKEFINLKQLKDEGVRTNKEIQEEEKKKAEEEEAANDQSMFGKLFNITPETVKVIKWGAIGLGSLLAYNAIAPIIRQQR